MPSAVNEAYSNHVLPTHRGTEVLGRLQPKAVYLDGLRGLAALLVYFQHHTVYFYTDAPGIDLGYGASNPNGTINHQFASLPIIRLLFTGGSAAVSIFFVLSGYVLSRKPLGMIKEHKYDQCSSSLKSAVIRRPFRLYMPLIAVTLIFAAWLHLPFGLAPKVNMPAKQANLLAELSHCIKELVIYLNPFQQHGWYIAWFPYNGTLWTIPIELKGSMLVFGLLYLMKSPASPRIESYSPTLLRIVAYALLASGQWSMSLFVFGITLAIRDVDRSFQLQSVGSILSSKYPRLIYLFRHIQLGVALYLLSQPVKGQDVGISSSTPGWYWLTKLIPSTYLRDEYYRFYHAIGAVILVHAVLRISWLQSFLSTEPLLYLGRVSFSFYLIHIPMLWVYGDRVQRLIGVHGRNWNGPLWVDRKLANFIPDVGPVGLSTRFLVAVWAVLPVLLTLAAVSTDLLDETSIRFSHWASWKLGFDAREISNAKTAQAGRRSSTKTSIENNRID